MSCYLSKWENDLQSNYRRTVVDTERGGRDGVTQVRGPSDGKWSVDPSRDPQLLSSTPTVSFTFVLVRLAFHLSRKRTSL